MSPAEDSPTYPREMVYSSIDMHVAPHQRETAKEKFATRYGESVWGDEVPLLGIQRILVLEHLPDLI